MKLVLLTIVAAVLLHASLVSCFPDDSWLSRVKRSNETEEGFTHKVKSGLKSFGSKVSNVASKGYNEVLNYFSSDRKVGDYQLNNIDVRVAEEEDYEEVGVKRPKRDVKQTKNVNVSHTEVDLDEIVEAINVLRATESKKFSIVFCSRYLILSISFVQRRKSNSRTTLRPRPDFHKPWWSLSRH